MYTFLVTLHVLAAILVVGPFLLATWSGQRAVTRRAPDRVRESVRSLRWFAIGSLVVALLGAAALSATDEWRFGSPWVTISMTLYLLTLAVATGVAIPALRRAATLLEGGVLAAPEPAAGATGDHTAGDPDAAGDRDAAGAGGQAAGPATVRATAEELGTKATLDRLAGRIAAAGGGVALGFVLITILMAWRPFGK